jgi:hypothetical protein
MRQELSSFSELDTEELHHSQRQQSAKILFPTKNVSEFILCEKGMYSTATHKAK